MDKKEVITLSSDDESDFTRIEHKNPEANPSKSKKGFEDFFQSCLNKYKEITVQKNVGVHVECKKQRIQILEYSKFQKKIKKTTQDVPEIVDLEDCSEKSVENEEVKLSLTNSISKDVQNHSSSKVINIDEVTNDPVPKIKTEPNAEKQSTNSLTNQSEKVKENSSEDADLKPGKKCLNETHKNEGSDRNLQFFTEFVENCGSLEVNPNDRTKLTKKLMKRYGEADCKYIKSPEFKNLIQKSKAKVNKNNLYLIAKEVTEELTFRKRVAPNSGKSIVVEEKRQRPPETIKENKIIEEKTNKQMKKRTRVINKIIKKLDKLGCKIRELEEKEVDLDDEEESTYLQLQRYRERFCQIYTKLCKFTNEIPDADRVCNRKVCFTESKYPAINRCIENWLNKTKRFPDFLDIMKLLESQSTSLGLPSNRDTIRAIATEIFQQVGAMLQRRRKYDLWDSFCGFLDNAEDPADKDPLLDRILRNNFDTRVKKEQEIFQQYVELQEKKGLEPEEIPDDEANCSPVDSGNEDDKEIGEVEDSMNKKVDDEIKKDTEEEISDNTVKNLKENPAKESKNNYKNCKSLKWRLESVTKGKSENADKVKLPVEPKPEKNDSDVEMMEPNEGTLAVHTVAQLNGIGNAEFPLKRKHEDEDTVPNKKAKNKENDEDVDIFDVEDESEPIMEEKNEVFEIHCCQIFTNTAFDDWESEKEKNWGKRKVFKDLTNVNRLMGLHGRKKKNSAFFSPYFLHQSFFDKPSWKKQFKLNFRVSPKGQKCTLNQEEKEQKSNPESGGDRDEREKDVQNNSDGEENHEEGGDYVSGSGNGSEEDNNGDENKRNGRTDEDNQSEDEEEEDETEKEDSKPETDASEHSFHNEKTEEDLPPIEGASTCENEDYTTQVEASTDSPVTEADETKANHYEEFESMESFKVDVIEAESNAIEIDLTDTELDVDAEKRNISIKETDSTAEETDSEVNETNINIKEADLTVTESYLDGQKRIINKETDLDIPKANVTDSDVDETVNDEGNINIKETDVSDDEGNINVKETDVSDDEGNINVKDTDVSDDEGNINIEEADVNDDEGNTNIKETDLTVTESDLDIIRTSVNIEETESDVTKPKINIIKVDLDGNLDFNVQNTDVSNGEHDVTDKISKNGATENYLMDAEKSNPVLGTSSRIRVRGNLEEKGKKRLLNYGVVDVESENFVRMRRPAMIPRERKRRATTESTPLTYRKLLECQKMARRSTSSTSDEERVKRFLLHSPSSISITPPRTLTLPKPPSQAALQALATLRNLKGISTTIVRGGKPKSVGDGGLHMRRKRNSRELPVISNVQSIGMTTPKIVTVQGNVSGMFENPWAQVPSNGNPSSSIRISNVWGSLPNNFMQEGEVVPGCSFRQNDPRPANPVRKKTAKKTVEYVVLD